MLIARGAGCCGEERGIIGERHDADTGLLDPNARWYNPTTGFFLTPDWLDPVDGDTGRAGAAIGWRDNPVGTNRYAYAGQDPINANDPSEHCGQSAKGVSMGCEIVGMQHGILLGATVIDPQDPVAVNGHAMWGDGSGRMADFASVSIAGLSDSLHKLADQPGSSLSDAIQTAIATGSPQFVEISKLKAGGAYGGGTPLRKQFGLGRSSMAVHGTAVAGPASNVVTMKGAVTGEYEGHDSPKSERGAFGEALTKIGLAIQRVLGGGDYGIQFSGSQTIRAEFKKEEEIGISIGAFGSNTIWIVAFLFLAGCSLGGGNCKEFDPIKFKSLADGYIANSRERSAKRGLFKSEYSQATVRLEAIRRPTAEERVSDVAGVVPIDVGHRYVTLQIDNDCNFNYFDQ